MTLPPETYLLQRFSVLSPHVHVRVRLRDMVHLKCDIVMTSCHVNRFNEKFAYRSSVNFIIGGGCSQMDVGAACGCVAGGVSIIDSWVHLACGGDAADTRRVAEDAHFATTMLR